MDAPASFLVRIHIHTSYQASSEEEEDELADNVQNVEVQPVQELRGPKLNCNGKDLFGRCNIHILSSRGAKTTNGMHMNVRSNFIPCCCLTTIIAGFCQRVIIPPHAMIRPVLILALTVFTPVTWIPYY